MGIITKLLGSFVEANFSKDAEKLLRICRSYGAMERGHFKASAKLALAFLILDRENDTADSISLVIEVMGSGRKLSQAEAGQLSAYNLRLMNLQRQAHQSTNRVNNFIAAGIPVWITPVKGARKTDAGRPDSPPGEPGVEKRSILYSRGSQAETLSSV